MHAHMHLAIHAYMFAVFLEQQTVVGICWMRLRPDTTAARRLSVWLANLFPHLALAKKPSNQIANGPGECIRRASATAGD
jgi:hypothetical protein